MKLLSEEEIAELRQHVTRGGDIYEYDVKKEGNCTELVRRPDSYFDRLLDEVERSRALLKRIEWTGWSENQLRYCPECKGIDPSETYVSPADPARGWAPTIGHKPGCELAALLGDPT